MICYDKYVKIWRIGPTDQYTIRYTFYNIVENHVISSNACLLIVIKDLCFKPTFLFIPWHVCLVLLLLKLLGMSYNKDLCFWEEKANSMGIPTHLIASKDQSLPIQHLICYYLVAGAVYSGHLITFCNNGYQLGDELLCFSETKCW